MIVTAAFARNKIDSPRRGGLAGRASARPLVLVCLDGRSPAWPEASLTIAEC